jgi:hypothetical protein
MSRDSGSFKRSDARFKPQPRVLVLCEDTKSSKTYLEDASIYFRSYAVVEFAHCGRTDPLGIVQAAIGRQNDFEVVHCVIDRDNHQNFDPALRLVATAPKVELFTSYPCFEFWLLLHFTYSRAPYAPAGNLSAADRVIRDLRSKPGMGAYAKGEIKGLFDVLLPRLPQARIHAARALHEAVQDNEPNPSSPLHLLLAALEDLSTLQPI